MKKWMIVATKNGMKWMFSVTAHTREAARTLARQRMNTGWKIASMREA
jgi:hypothetical protein